MALVVPTELAILSRSSGAGNGGDDGGGGGGGGGGGDGGGSGGVVDISPFIASQAEAEAAEDNTKIMSPIKTREQIDARLVTQTVAEAGADNTGLMTAERAYQQTTARIADQVTAVIGTDFTKMTTPQRVAQAISARVHTRNLMEFRTGLETIDDGVTDAAPALTAAFQWMLTYGGIITPPRGVFALNSWIGLDSYVSPNLVNSVLGFGMIGAGRGATTFKIPAGNGAGAWEILFSAGKVYWTSVWQDFSIQVDGTKTNSIIRIGINQSTPSGGGAYRHVVMTRVDVNGTSTNPVCLTRLPVVDLTWTNRPIVDDCVITGSPADQSDPSASESSCCLDISHAYDPRVSRCDLSHAKTAINNVGGSQETCRIYDNSITGCSTGIRWVKASTPNDTFTITNITQANPGVVTAIGSNFTNGWRGFIRLVGGMNEINERHFTAAGATADTFQLTDPETGANIDTTGYGQYTSGGILTRHHTSGLQPLCIIGPNNHVHVSDVCIDVCGADIGSQIFKNDLHLSGVSPRYTQSHHIWVQKSQKVEISGNDCYRPGGSYELTTNGDFASFTGWSGTNWALNSGAAKHTTGSTAALSQTIALIPVVNYIVKFTITGRTAGSVTPAFLNGTTVTGTTRSTNATFSETLTAVTGNTALIFTPTTDFDGSIDDVSLFGGSDIFVDANGTFGKCDHIFGDHNRHFGGTNAIQVSTGATDVLFDYPRVVAPSYATPPFSVPSNTQVQIFSSPDRTTQRLISYDPGATRGPILDAYRKSGSPAANDLIGTVTFSGDNDASMPVQKTYASVEGRIDDKTSASEDGGLNFYAMKAGTETLTWQMGTSVGSYLKENITFIPAASATPSSNGDALFELTSNTTLKIKVKGSDGTVRSVSLTLA